MAGRISGLEWQAGGYVNPDMPDAVAQALAERGFNPDGTRKKLEALNQRITDGWREMNFMPFQTVADPRAEYVGNNGPQNIFVGANSPMADTGDPAFGADTLAKLAIHNQALDAGYDRTNALVDALLNPTEGEEEASAVADEPRRPISGMSFTPSLPEPMEAPAIPKPRLRPQPTSYTVRKGDNPTTIARALGISLADLERKNPGILKKARRLQVGSTLKV